MADRILTGALLLGSLAASLFVADLTLGWLGLGSREAFPGLLKPGRFTYVNLEFEQHQRNDSRGLRVSGFDPAAERANVLLLGDSFVEGFGLSDEETFAWKLNDDYRDRGVQFLNAGKGGANLRDYRRAFARIRDSGFVEFDAAILFVTLGNDLLDYEALARVVPPPKRKKWKPLRRIRALIGLALDRERRRNQWFEADGISTYVEWYDENLAYFGRTEPLSEPEKQEMRESFARIDPAVRAALRVGLANAWVYQNLVTPGMDDFVFDLGSEANRTALRSSLAMLGALADEIPSLVAVVLVPDQMQVSQRARDAARVVLGPRARTEEFRDMLAVDAEILQWLARERPRLTAIDLSAPMLEAGGGERFYFPIDGHLNPAGADLVRAVVSTRVPALDALARRRH